ncbi:MAG: hypothetical protein KC468_15190 [Myxococcales bacterium]|nr:hypothetical protein [Myxococcales bacterium]
MPCGDPLPPEGSACDREGEFCSSGCEDPCQFCNVLECSEGAWQGLEVFPAPCLSCEEICPLIVASGCSGGAPDMDSCLSGCVDSMAACSLEHNQMLACVGPAPTITCDAMDRPSVAGCEESFQTLYDCLAG